MVGVQRFASGRAAGELLDLLGADRIEDRVVDGDGGCAVTAAEAARVFDLNLVRARIQETAGKLSAEFRGTVETATHIGADEDFRFGGGSEMEVGIEASDAVELVERSLRALRKGFEFGFGQIAAPQLDGSQFVEDHRSVGSRCAPAVKQAERGMIQGYFRTDGPGNVAKMAGRCLFAQSPEKGLPAGSRLR